MPQNATEVHNTYSPFAHPVYVMAKPVGSACNMRCTYCYYLEKAQELKSEVKESVMSLETLEHYIRQYLECQTTECVLFTWHGGEPLLRGIEFYQRVVELEQKWARGRRVDNCIQTNGTLLTPEWARFFAQHEWLVGVSVDGDEEQHDALRHMSANPTSGSHTLIMRGIDMLNQAGVMWNAMATVNALNAQEPERFYNFFVSHGCQYIQFTPVVERRVLSGSRKGLLAMPNDDERNAELTPWSVTPDVWGQFLCRLFDQWVRRDVGRIFVQTFDATLANWVGEQPGVCTLAKTCGHASVMEHNGDVYSCDHFVFPEYRLGNINTSTLTEMMYNPQQQAFGNAKHDTLPRQCRECQWLFACNGECPKNRIIHTATGEPGLNYLCQGYRQFFEHVAPYMDYMKQQLLQQQPPANIMQAIRRGEL